MEPTHKYVCVADFQRLAKQKLSTANFNYIQLGSGDGITKRRNQEAFRQLVIIPRVLRQVTEVDVTVNILGKRCLAFGFAAWAANRIADSEKGELIPAKVASDHNICYTLSNLSNTHPNQISQMNPTGLKLLQLYLLADEHVNDRLLVLAAEAGFDGVIITVDAQILGIRNRGELSKAHSESLSFPIFQELDQAQGGTQNLKKQDNSMQKYREMRDLGVTWKTIEKIRRKTSLKIVLKGIMHPQDAKIAASYCDAIYISNHGGRQLDTVPATVQVLPEVKQVIDNLPVQVQKPAIFVDGGVRSGNDIFKCLALGADCVFLGRPVAYSLAGGEEGVAALVGILKDELCRTMILCGTQKISEITPKYIGRRSKL